MCCITLCGDLIAQWTERRLESRKKEHLHSEGCSDGTMDTRRLLAVSVDALLYSGPLTWCAYEVRLCMDVGCIVIVSVMAQ